MRSWQSGRTRPIVMLFGRGADEQLIPPAVKSAYQPSDSIFMFVWLQASGLELMDIDDLIRRAVYPNIFCVSPVGVALVLIVNVPPRRVGVLEEPDCELFAGCVELLALSSSIGV